MNGYYVDYLKSAGKSDKTIAVYVNSVELMLKNIGKSEEKITFLDLVKWQSQLQVNGKSTSTIHTKVVAVKNYFEFLTNAHIVAENPTTALVTPKVINKKKPDPTADMIRALIENARNKRDKAMLIVFATTGMRFDEATSVTLEQYKQRKFEIIGKGNKRREIFINDEAKRACDEYLAERTDESKFLFVSGKGNKVDNANWCKGIKTCAKKAGLECWKEISPHWLRHAFATQASQMGVPVADIGFALGHSDYAKVTTTYIHTPQNKVKDIMSEIKF